MAFLKHPSRLLTNLVKAPSLRHFSNKQFDYQSFEEEIRKERQKNKNQQNKGSSGFDYSQQQQRSQQSTGGTTPPPSSLQLTPQVTKDLQLLNVPKYVSKEDLKKQYHKLAKIYHPDILQSKNKATSSTTSLMTETQRVKLEERFKEFNLAYERVLKWVGERDQQLDDDLINNRHPGVKVNREDGSVTYTLGKLQIEGKRSNMDKQQLLLEMIEEDLNLKEPVNMRRNLFILWGIFGIWIFYKDFSKYYQTMSQPREGVDYDSYFKVFNRSAVNKVQQ